MVSYNSHNATRMLHFFCIINQFAEKMSQTTNGKHQVYVFLTYSLYAITELYFYFIAMLFILVHVGEEVRAG